MLGKLLKYDFKSLGKKLLPYFLGVVVLAIFNKLFGLIASDNMILSIPKGFLMVAFVLALIGVPMVTFVLGITRFYQNLIKDEGYLVNTLPVKKSSIIASKCIVANTYLLLSVVISLVAALFVFYNPELWTLLSDFWTQLSTVFTPGLLILMIVVSVLSFIMQYFMFTLAIALGQMQNTKKGMYSFVYAIVLYTVSQVISSVALFGYLLVDPNLMDKLNSDIPSTGALYGLMWITFVITIVMCVGYYYATVYIFNKKLNLE